MLHYSLPNEDASRDSAGFSAVDISLPSEAANVAEITLTSRYPETGLTLNTESEMIVRVLEGETVFSCDREEISLPAGSTILVQTNRPYCWIPRGSVRLYVVSTPPWTAQQQRSIPA